MVEPSIVYALLVVFISGLLEPKGHYTSWWHVGEQFHEEIVCHTQNSI